MLINIFHPQLWDADELCKLIRDHHSEMKRGLSPDKRAPHKFSFTVQAVSAGKGKGVPISIDPDGTLMLLSPMGIETSLLLNLRRGRTYQTIKQCFSPTVFLSPVDPVDLDLIGMGACYEDFDCRVGNTPRKKTLNKTIYSFNVKALIPANVPLGKISQEMYNNLKAAQDVVAGRMSGRKANFKFTAGRLGRLGQGS